VIKAANSSSMVRRQFESMRATRMVHPQQGRC
jgi:hypothetical protein